MVVPTEIRKRAIPTVSYANALLEQLPGESLAKAVEFLEALSHEGLHVSEAPPKTSEAALLQIIQRRLSPEEQVRLAYLRSANETGEITEAEHEELLMYIEKVEQQDVNAQRH
jgi:glucose-6-phosphate isomerase